MTLAKHEFRLGWKALVIWTAAITAFVAMCIFIYPEMSGEMEKMGKLFSAMGALTAAFGLDKLNFGTLTGFYAVESGNVLGIGGALFAGLTGANILCREEKERTAEYLLTHPVSRSQAVTGKLLALLAQIFLLNLTVYLVAIVSISAIGYDIPWKDISLLHIGCLLAQLELGCIGLGLSAFLRRGGMGIGMGLAICMYFLNIIANLTKKARFLKYCTPFAYADGADILSRHGLDMTLVAIGICAALVSIAAAYWQYSRKDIH